MICIRAGFAVRVLAALVDALVALALTLALSSSAGVFFARRAVVMLKIDDPASMWKGPLPFMLGAIGEVVYLLPLTLFVAWSLDPLAGGTIGKRCFRLQVRDATGAVSSRWRSWGRTALWTVGLWGCTIGLIAGRWEIALVALIAWMMVAAGTLLALGPASLALHDRLTGTSVVRVDRS